MSSIRTKTRISKVIALTAGGAVTQTLGGDYSAGLLSAWPVSESAAATAFARIQNTTGGTCTLSLFAPADAGSATPFRVLDASAAATAGELPRDTFGPFTRSEWAALEFRFSGAGTAIVAFQLVLEEGGAQ